MTNMQQIFNVLQKGYKCTTGCKSGACGCKRIKTQYSEGCQCTNCENIHSALPHEQDSGEQDINIIMLEEEAVKSK